MMTVGVVWRKGLGGRKSGVRKTSEEVIVTCQVHKDESPSWKVGNNESNNNGYFSEVICTVTKIHFLDYISQAPLQLGVAM